MTSVDERDLALLKLLEDDSRLAWRRIARELGVSEATVYLRVKKLTQDGVIEGYTVKVNPERLGLSTTIFALVRIEARMVRDIRRRLSMLKYVSEAYEITGHYHFLVKITAPSFSEAARIIDELMNTDGVVEVSTFTALRKIRDGSRVVRDYIEWSRGGPARA